MSQSPPITLSRLDLERLETLLARQPKGNAIASALEEELVRAEVVEPKDVPAGVVTMRSTVRFRDLQSGRERTVTLCYPHEATGEGMVSVLAPAGAALLGLRAGQRIDWPSASGTLELELLEVTYQPEAAGDLDR